MVYGLTNWVAFLTGDSWKNYSERIWQQQQQQCWTVFSKPTHVHGAETGEQMMATLIMMIMTMIMVLKPI